ncbi:hypothetical protein LDENG_00086560 [Lucifuga dentata]|nr:hypothetical protein LDENG_00086560 [Lucifuga dentata]
MDFSYAFSTMVPELLVVKLAELNITFSICQWISSFLTNQKQYVKVGNFLSDPFFLSTGIPQGHTNDCTSSSSSVKLKFADDTTVVGLISNRDETSYREEVSHLVSWCNDHNLEFNTTKTRR